MPVLPAGTTVPEFTLLREDGGEFTRSDLEGRTTVLAFFPAAFSGVCSEQFSIYQEVIDDFQKLDASVYGVSCDQRESQTAFRESLNATIPMLSDWEPKGEASRAFGVYWEPTGVSNRALVVIGPDLTIRYAWEGEHPGILPGPNLVFDGLSA